MAHKCVCQVGAAVLGYEQGGSRYLDLGEDLRSGSSGGHAIEVRDMEYDTTHREGFGWIPPQGGPKAEGKTTSNGTGRWMGVSPSGGRNVRGRIK